MGLLPTPKKPIKIEKPGFGPLRAPWPPPGSPWALFSLKGSSLLALFGVTRCVHLFSKRAGHDRGELIQGMIQGIKNNKAPN